MFGKKIKVVISDKVNIQENQVEYATNSILKQVTPQQTFLIKGSHIASETCQIWCKKGFQAQNRLTDVQWWYTQQSIVDMHIETDDQLMQLIDQLNAGKIASISNEKLIITSQQNLLQFVPILQEKHATTVTLPHATANQLICCVLNKQYYIISDIVTQLQYIDFTPKQQMQNDAQPQIEVAQTSKQAEQIEQIDLQKEQTQVGFDAAHTCVNIQQDTGNEQSNIQQQLQQENTGSTQQLQQSNEQLIQNDNQMQNTDQIQQENQQQVEQQIQSQQSLQTQKTSYSQYYVTPSTLQSNKMQQMSTQNTNIQQQVESNQQQEQLEIEEQEEEQNIKYPIQTIQNAHIIKVIKLNSLVFHICQNSTPVLKNSKNADHQFVQISGNMSVGDYLYFTPFRECNWGIYTMKENKSMYNTKQMYSSQNSIYSSQQQQQSKLQQTHMLPQQLQNQQINILKQNQYKYLIEQGNQQLYFYCYLQNKKDKVFTAKLQYLTFVKDQLKCIYIDRTNNNIVVQIDLTQQEMYDVDVQCVLITDNKITGCKLITDKIVNQSYVGTFKLQIHNDAYTIIRVDYKVNESNKVALICLERFSGVRYDELQNQQKEFVQNTLQLLDK